MSSINLDLSTFNNTPLYENMRSIAAFNRVMRQRALPVKSARMKSQRRKLDEKEIKPTETVDLKPYIDITGRAVRRTEPLKLDDIQTFQFKYATSNYYSESALRGMSTDQINKILRELNIRASGATRKEDKIKLIIQQQALG